MSENALLLATVVIVLKPNISVFDIHVCELFDSKYNTSANQNVRLSIRNFANILCI